MLGNAADRHQTGRGDGLRQRFGGAVGDRLNRLPGEQAGVALCCGGGGEHLPHRTRVECGRHEVGTLDQETRRAAAPGVTLEFDRGHHPGRPLRQRSGVRRRQAASPDGALTSAGSALRATSTSAVNAAGSLTAISARFLRSTSTPAALRPWIRRL